MRQLVTRIVLVIALMSCGSPAWCWDEDQGFNRISVRGGLMATNRNENFHQYEVGATFGLPWSVRWDSGWGFALQADTAMGVVHPSTNDNSFIMGVGPGLILAKAGGKGAALEIGGKVNYLSHYRFEEVDLNGHFLWTGHAGVLYRFDSGPGIGYRFQHMSNGGLNGKRNTGLDFHMAEISWNFH